jgi:ATP-dependent Clp protease adaptor protein ClpS
LTHSRQEGYTHTQSAEVAEPRIGERILPHLDEDSDSAQDNPYIVILYNDDYHDMEQVASQLQRATGYDWERCVRIMLEAHTRGRAIAFTGSQTECERVAQILRQIRLQVETDRF